MDLNQKLYELLKLFAPSANGNNQSLSVKDIEYIIQSDGSKIKIGEVQILLDKLVEDKYVYLDQDRHEREFTGLPLYKYYKISFEGESVLREFEMPTIQSVTATPSKNESAAKPKWYGTWMFKYIIWPLVVGLILWLISLLK